MFVAMTNAVAVSDSGVDVLTKGFPQDEEIRARQSCHRPGAQAQVRLPPRVWPGLVTVSKALQVQGQSNLV